MRPISAILLAFAFLSPSLDAASPGATDNVAVVDLGGLWDFAYTPDRADALPGAERFRMSLPVPGCWDDSLPRTKALELWPDARFNPDYAPLQIPAPPKANGMPDASLPYLLGTGWHRRRLDVPADWQGRQVVLRVGRVVMEAWVYVNGRLVHHHLGHSTPWEVVLSPYLKPGTSNEMVIAVDNRRNDRLGCIIRGYKGRSGGIFGPVSLKISGQVRIADMHVFAEGDRLVWRAELDGNLPKDASLRWSVIDPRDGRVLGQGVESAKQSRLDWTTQAKGIPFWSDESPTLVDVRLELADGLRRIDTLQRSFGRRRLTRDGTGLRLNGRSVFLRGLCDSAYFPETCTPPLDVAWYRHHVQNLKRLGFNWIRAHTWTMTEEYLQAADELGMMVQVEPPVGYEMPEWIDILRDCRKHPSVVIYCCGNEEMLDEPRIEFLRQCREAMRAEVPDGLFNPQEAMRGIEYVLEGVPRGELAKKPFPHHPKRLAAVREFSDVFGQYAWGWLSYKTLQGEPKKIDRCLAIYGRPCLTHEMCLRGCYMDLSLESRYRGTRIGTELYAKVRASLAKAGLLDRADRYYKNAAAWQRILRKDVCETARHCRTLAGYDMLGACDLVWHRTGYACGILNEFDEMKPGETPADVLRYNGPSVLLISRQRDRNLWAGEPFSREVSVSWFDAKPLAGDTLQWSLTTPEGKRLGEGRQTVGPVEPGQVARLAEIRLDLPAIQTPTKATLRVVLAHAGQSIDNQWDYWIFPRVIGPSPGIASKDVLMTSKLDDAALRRLARGGRVVLLGNKPLPAAKMNFQSAMAGRPFGNLATVIERHPLTDQFPHDGYCDWQFAPMMQKAVNIQFNRLDVPFDPIIEVVSSYKQILKQAVLFEWRVGRGRLLVCGFSLANHDPACAYFRQLLHEYAYSKAFQPRTAVSIEQLAKLVRLKTPPPQEEEKTDEGFDAAGHLPAKP